MTLKDYIYEAIAGKNRSGMKKYVSDNIDGETTIEEFINILNYLGYVEDKTSGKNGGQQDNINNLMFGKKGAVYRIVTHIHNQIRVLVKSPRIDDEYFRVMFNEYSGNIYSIQRVCKTNKVGDYKYLATTSNTKELMDYMWSA